MFERARNFSKIPMRFLSKKTGWLRGLVGNLPGLVAEAFVGLSIFGKKKQGGAS